MPYQEPTSVLNFMGATVISFNTTLGIGSTSESSLNVELVEDCGQTCYLGNTYNVGDAVIFPDNSPNGFEFQFGGVLTNWTYNSGKSGRTYSCTVVDPRQILENAIVVFDNYFGPPEIARNYFNVAYAAEGKWLFSNDPNSCSYYGSLFATERGVPYYNILQTLMQTEGNGANLIYSTTGQAFRVKFSQFPYVPPYYRIPGPSVTLLDLLQQACDATAQAFYCELAFEGGEPTINIGYIPLYQNPYSFNNQIANQYGQATDISYGEELRNGKTRTVMLGEQQHYMTWTDLFAFYFGEDQNPYLPGLVYPVLPVAYTATEGFWIYKSIRELQSSLIRPLIDPSVGFASYGPYFISEMDIRAAMASYELWQSRALSPHIPGGLNWAIRTTYLTAAGKPLNSANNFIDMNIMAAGGNMSDLEEQALAGNFIDAMNSPRPGSSEYDNIFEKDLQTIHGWVKNLGDTYYGKQWFARLSEKICVKLGENFKELIFTDVPTNAGGWIEQNYQILGLDPIDLELFRNDDGRVNAFLGFLDQRYTIITPEQQPKPVEPPEDNNMGN